MKKLIITLALAVAMMSSFASCGTDDGSSANTTTTTAASTTAASTTAATEETTVPETTEAEVTTANGSSSGTASFGEKTGETSGKYAPGERFKKIMSELTAEGKKVNMVLRGETETFAGAKELVTITTVTDGNNIALDMSGGEQPVCIVYKADEGKYYMISHADKAIIVMKMSLEDFMKESGDSPIAAAYDEAYYSDASKFSSGTEVINGKTYDYDQVLVKDSEETRYYYETDKEEIKYISTAGDMMEIIKMDNNPDMSIFTIPTNYEVTDLSSLLEGLTVTTPAQ